MEDLYATPHHPGRFDEVLPVARQTFSKRTLVQWSTVAGGTMGGIARQATWREGLPGDGACNGVQPIPHGAATTR
jgi:hypothetical protein